MQLKNIIRVCLICFASAIPLIRMCVTAGEPPNDPGSRWSAEQYARKTIYHSVQKPGYTCWLGAWQMPDYSLMITFKEVTGPAQGRPRAKVEWQEAFGLMKVDPARDFTGLLMADMYLRSAILQRSQSAVSKLLLSEELSTRRRKDLRLQPSRQ